MKKSIRRTSYYICAILLCFMMAGCGKTESRKTGIVKDNWSFSEVIDEKGKDNSEYFVMGNDSYSLYSNTYFNYFFEKEEYTLEEIFAIAEANSNIPKEYMPTLKEFLERVYNYYPELDWRVFLCNLESLKFTLVDSDNYEFENVAARYILGGENRIEIREDINLSEDELSLRVFRHELGHVFNSLSYSEGGRKLKFSFQSASDGKRGNAIVEAMTVIFTTDPYKGEYHDDNLGYSIFTNIIREINDYTELKTTDYLSHNVEYYEENLDKYIPEGRTAREFTDNFDFFMEKAAAGTVESDMPEIEIVYECVARMYIAKYITSDMSESDIMAREQELEERLLLGAPNPEYVYTDVVKRVFREYISNRIK